MALPTGFLKDFGVPGAVAFILALFAASWVDNPNNTAFMALVIIFFIAFWAAIVLIMKVFRRPPPPEGK